MIVFLHGPDTFRSRQKLNAIIAAKTKKTAGFNVYRLGPQNYDFLKFWELIERVSIFEDKKLIVLEGLLNGPAENLEGIEKLISEKRLAGDAGNLLIFWDGGISDKIKKTPLCRLLEKEPVKSQKFGNLGGARLRNWILKEIQSRSGKIDSAALDALILAVPDDLWRLDREIDKLIAYKKGEAIKAADVKALVAADFSTNIFELTDALGRKNRRGALIILDNELKNGRSELEILGMITGHFRRLVSLRSMVDSGRALSASVLGFHPFVFQKALNQCHNFSLSDLKKKFRKIAETDLLIKTGKIDKRAGLEMLIFNLGG